MVVGSELIWPKWIDAVERQIIQNYMAKVQPALAQDVLDEMEWIKSTKDVHNAAGLARKLVALVRANEFVAEGAHKVKSDRIQAQRIALAVAAVEQSSSLPKQPPLPTYSGVPPHIKQRLAEGAAALKAKIGR